jgi:hypothetical protein
MTNANSGVHLLAKLWWALKQDRLLATEYDVLFVPASIPHPASPDDRGRHGSRDSRRRLLCLNSIVFSRWSPGP